MKRLFDLSVAILCGIILALPFLLLVYLVRSRFGSPVFFTQVRPGLNGKPFRMFKFRSMTDERSPNGELLPDSERLTRFGAMLRSTSLDELPELLNVFKGEMSLVGPRPLLMEYLKLYTPEQSRRHDVLPGITGWAQVNGRNAISWDEKFALDIWYIDNHNLWLDIKILLLTVRKVLVRDGINSPGEVTASKFTGAEK